MSIKINASAVAGSVPFDNTGTPYLTANVQDALIDIRNRQILNALSITTSLNGLTTLTNVSESQIVFQGTATGHRLRLPDATTLTNGHLYQAWNLSSQNVIIQNSAGTELVSLRPNSQTFIVLYNNTTATGQWSATFTLDNGNVFGTNLYFAEANPETSTNSTTTFLNKITLNTPSLPLGDYLVQFQFIWRAANASRSLDVRIQRAGTTIQTWQPFTANLADRQLLSGFVRQTSISGPQTLTLDFKVVGTATTVFMQQARLFIWRIG